MNKLPARTKTGTFGELLVQLRLFQYDIQAAPPLKDSGNDLIAIRGEVFRTIQVKTTAAAPIILKKLQRKYHVLALVQIFPLDAGELKNAQLDRCHIFLLRNAELKPGTYDATDLAKYELNEERVKKLFE